MYSVSEESVLRGRFLSKAVVLLAGSRGGLGSDRWAKTKWTTWDSHHKYINGPGQENIGGREGKKY